VLLRPAQLIRSAPIERQIIINTLDSHDSDEISQDLYSRFERAARDNSNVEASDEVMPLESLLAYAQLYRPRLQHCNANLPSCLISFVRYLH
jgi:hypothetical protein